MYGRCSFGGLIFAWPTWSRSANHRKELLVWRANMCMFTREYLGGSIAGFGGGVMLTEYLIWQGLLPADYPVLAIIFGTALIIIGASIARSSQKKESPPNSGVLIQRPLTAKEVEKRIPQNPDHPNKSPEPPGNGGH
jgi:hypothetical protein